jgi:hypothetical protein
MRRFFNCQVGPFLEEMFGENDARRAVARQLVKTVQFLPAGALLQRRPSAVVLGDGERSASTAVPIALSGGEL